MVTLKELYIRFHPKWVQHDDKTETTEEELETGTKYTKKRISIYRHVGSAEEATVPYRPTRYKVWIVWDDGEKSTVKRSLHLP